MARTRNETARPAMPKRCGILPAPLKHFLATTFFALLFVAQHANAQVRCEASGHGASFATMCAEKSDITLVSGTRVTVSWYAVADKDGFNATRIKNQWYEKTAGPAVAIENFTQDIDARGQNGNTNARFEFIVPFVSEQTDIRFKFYARIDIKHLDDLTAEINSRKFIIPANSAPQITSLGGSDEATLHLPKGTQHAVTVAATDLNNQTLTYSILEEFDHEAIWIERSTGRLLFRNGQATTAGRYKVRVKVTDGDAEDTQLIHLVIVDDTDVTLSENTQEVATITPTTAPPAGANLVYSILSDHDAAVFEITPQGVLRFRDAPDYENPRNAQGDIDQNEDQGYWVVVKISDGASFTDTQLIRVSVTDVSPRITGGDEITVYLPTGATHVTTITATDGGTYSIPEEEDFGSFSIDENTRVLSFKETHIPSRTRLFIVKVQVTDGSAVDTQLINVVIVPDTDVMSPENTQEVATIMPTTSPPAGANLVYSVSNSVSNNDVAVLDSVSNNDAAAFEITPQGALRFKDGYIPDYENPRDSLGNIDQNADQEYRVLVTVSDGGSFTDNQLIKVTITDVNEPPTDIELSSTEVARNAMANRRVGLLSVIDMDADGIYTYTFVPGAGSADNGLFTIDGTNLIIVSTPAAGKSSYNIRINVSNGIHDYSKTFTISVSDDASLMDDFFTTWRVTAGQEITIPTTGSGYSYTVDWGAGEMDTDTYTGNATHTYTDAGDYTVRIKGDFPRIYFNAYDGNANSNSIIAINQWGTGQWTSMEKAFSGATNLIGEATDSPDLSQVTNMWGMFRHAENFNQDIGDWDVSNVESMGTTFEYAYAFNQDIGDWNVSNVTNMTYMFANATAFNQDISGWDVSSVTTMSNMFNNTPAFSQNLGRWYITGDLSILPTLGAGGEVTTFTAQNAVLSGQNPTYTLATGGDAGSFTLTDGVLSINDAPTVANTSYNIRIEATGSFGEDNHRDLTLIVNHNSPEITSHNGVSSYAITLAEHTQAVTTIIATDADMNTLSYALSNDDVALFEITDSGALRFKDAYIPNYDNPRDSLGNIDSNVDQEYSVSVTVSDGTSSDTQEIIVTIIRLVAPIISISTDMLIATVGTAIETITLDATAGGMVASYSINPVLPSGLLFDTATGTISGTPIVTADLTTYTITATNVAGSATVMVDITVNAPSSPTAIGMIDNITDLTVNGSPRDVDVASKFSALGTLTFTATSDNTATATVTVAGSVVSITPVAAGTTTITVTATNTAGQTAEQTFTVTVQADDVPNPAPTAIGMIDNITDLTVNGSPRDVDVASKFSALGTLTFTATSSSTATATVTVAGSVVTITPVAAGTTTITVTVANTAVQTAEQTFTVTVQTDDVTNPAPTAIGMIDNITDLMVNGSPRDVDVASKFSALGTLTFTATSDNTATATVTVAGSVVTIMPVATGTTTITVTATDIAGQTAEQTFTVTVQADDVTNPAPTAIGMIDNITDLMVNGSPRDVDVASKFSALGTLTFTATSSSTATATVTVAGSVVTIMPVAAGTTTITVTATNTAVQTAEQMFTVTVQADDATTGTAGVKNIDVSVSPNPIKDGDRVTITVASDGVYRLLGISGEFLTKGTLTKGDNAVTFPSLAKGIYLLQIQTKHGRVTRKVVKN